MLILGIKEARQNLTKLLKQVETGEEVIITHRDKPVARLLPIEDRREHKLASRRDLRDRIEDKGRSLSKVISRGRQRIAMGGDVPTTIAADGSDRIVSADGVTGSIAGRESGGGI